MSSDLQFSGKKRHRFYTYFLYNLKNYTVKMGFGSRQMRQQMEDNVYPETVNSGGKRP